MADPDYEKLGAFYLGRPYDAEADELGPQPFLYDAKDLTTHAVILGMTGSGKTGLAVTLLEEAAIDGIPIIAIDPKGDLPNLMLTFPQLRPEDFRPWISEADAARKGRSPDEHAKATADLWRNGLGEWDQKPARIGRFAKASERVIYTPGSRAGVPVSALGSFAPPRSGDGRGRETRARDERGVGVVGPARYRCRSDPQPRAHPPFESLPARLGSGPGPRPADADPPDPGSADRTRRRPRPRQLLPAEGSLRTGDDAEQSARVAGLRGVDRGPASRHAEDPLRPEGTATLDLLDRAPQ